MWERWARHPKATVDNTGDLGVTWCYKLKGSIHMHVNVQVQLALRCNKILIIITLRVMQPQVTQVCKNSTVWVSRQNSVVDISSNLTCFTIFEVHSFHDNKVMPVHLCKCNCVKERLRITTLLYMSQVKIKFLCLLTLLIHWLWIIRVGRQRKSRIKLG